MIVGSGLDVGATGRSAQALGVRRIDVTLTHEADVVAAVVVLEGKGSTRSAADQRVLEKQKLDSGAEKRLERFAGRVDNRLALDVEARV